MLFCGLPAPGERAKKGLTWVHTQPFPQTQNQIRLSSQGAGVRGREGVRGPERKAELFS